MPDPWMASDQLPAPDDPWWNRPGIGAEYARAKEATRTRQQFPSSIGDLPTAQVQPGSMPFAQATGLTMKAIDPQFAIRSAVGQGQIDPLQSSTEALQSPEFKAGMQRVFGSQLPEPVAAGLGAGVDFLTPMAMGLRPSTFAAAGPELAQGARGLIAGESGQMPTSIASLRAMRQQFPVFKNVMANPEGGWLARQVGAKSYNPELRQWESLLGPGEANRLVTEAALAKVPVAQQGGVVRGVTDYALPRTAPVQFTPGMKTVAEMTPIELASAVKEGPGIALHETTHGYLQQAKLQPELISNLPENMQHLAHAGRSTEPAIRASSDVLEEALAQTRNVSPNQRAAVIQDFLENPRPGYEGRFRAVSSEIADKYMRGEFGKELAEQGFDGVLQQLGQRAQQHGRFIPPDQMRKMWSYGQR